MTASETADPLLQVLFQNLMSFGDTSLFILLCLYIVLGSVREWWVPGRRYRRLEEASIEMTKANAVLREQNSDLIKSNQITQHFFQETTPKRGGSSNESIPAQAEEG